MGDRRPNATQKDVAEDVSKAEARLGKRESRLWKSLRIGPSRWEQAQHPGAPPFWVIAILGSRCLYLNEVEGGWGWGGYIEWGTIAEFHFQQDEIEHVIYQTLFDIDNSDAESSWMCCFCGLKIDPPDGLTADISLETGDGSSQGLRAHQRCLVRHLHPSVPLLNPDENNE